jgi:hypothetical protein
VSVSTRINRVRFIDGEGIAHSDFNDVQQYMRAFIVDQIIGGCASDTLSDARPDESRCYVPTAAHCMVYGSSSSLVTNTPGVIMQWKTADYSDGMTPELLAYFVEEDELETSIDLPDATNPRWDGLFIKLEDDEAAGSETRDFKDITTGVVTSSSVNKKNRTKLTLTYVAGTPAATNISFPSTPAGHVPLVYVCVPPGAATTPALSGVCDARMPMRMGSVDIMPGQMFDGGGATAASMDAKQHAIIASNSNVKVAVPFLVGPHCRVTGMDLWFWGTGSSTVTVTPKQYAAPNSSASTWTTSAVGLRSEVYPDVWSTAQDGATYHDYRTLKNSTGSGNGVALWGSGVANSMYGWKYLQDLGPVAGSPGGVTKAGVELSFSDEARIYGARFYYSY